MADTLVHTMTCDVGIWGDHVSSAWAACAVAEQGYRPLLFTDSRWIGTPYTSGLGKIDIGRYGGSSLNMGKWINDKFFRYLSRYFGERFQIKQGSPSMIHSAIMEMLSFYGVPVLVKARLHEVQMTGAFLDTIESCTVKVGEGDPDAPSPQLIKIVAPRWVDGSEDGDFADKTGRVQWRTGREGVAEFNESYAGFRPFLLQFNEGWDWRPTLGQGSTDPYTNTPIRGVRPFPLTITGQPLAVGQPDPDSCQPGGWRLSLTNVPRNKRRWPMPIKYDRSLFEYRLRRSNKSGKGFNYSYEDPDYRPLGNPQSFTAQGKTDHNDDSGTGSVSWKWARSGITPQEREDLFQDMANEYFGYRYFLANDPLVEPRVRQHCAEWGPAADEFAISSKVSTSLLPATGSSEIRGVPGGYPYTFYRRGGRRLKNAYYTMSQKDVQDTPDQYKVDTIGLSLYGLDCHTVQRLTNKPGEPIGIYTDSNNGPSIDLNYNVGATEVPLRCMLTTDVTNLVVSNCVGSTHVAYSKLRIDIWKANQGAVAGLLCADSIRRGRDMKDYVATPLETNVLLTNPAYGVTPGAVPGIQQLIVRMGGAIHCTFPPPTETEPPTLPARRDWREGDDWGG